MNKQCAGYDGSKRCTSLSTKVIKSGNGKAGVCTNHAKGETVIGNV